MNIELLNKALNNENNEGMICLTSNIIENTKTKIYDIICLNGNEIIKIDNQLQNYIYVDTIDKLKIGHYIRWINNKKKYLNRGGILKEINISNESINLIIKSFNGKCFTLIFNDNFVFQKLSNQENVLLKALDFINGH